MVLPAVLALAAALILAAADAPVNAVDPVVHVMIHVPLSGMHLDAYRRELQQYGRVTDHIGRGTWTNAHTPDAPLASEAVDHIELTTDLRTARSFLPTFLRLFRIAEHQQETLGEIFGGSYGTPDQARTRIIVRLRPADATPLQLDRLHHIFANNGDGGDSTYAARGAIVDYSGVRPADAGRIEAQLQRDGFAFTVEPETFITDDEATD